MVHDRDMPPPRTVSLILFDLDGTLVDHDAAAAVAVEQWVREEGWAVPGDVSALVQAWDEIAERHFPAYRARRTSFQGQRRARLRDFLPGVGVNVDGWSDARLDATFDGYLAAYEDAWKPFPDALPCLRSLRLSTRVAVMSNGDQAQQEQKVRRTGLQPFLTTVLTSGGLGVAKPDPHAFMRACDQLGAEPGETVYVGDRLDVDAIAATAAGLHGIWLNRDDELVPDGVTAISGLGQLPGVMMGLPPG